MTDIALSRYVSRVATEWPDPGERRWLVLDGTLVFVDISGFTKLSERLTKFGRMGAEELTEVLSVVFGGMLDIAYERGGALLKFGGDALLLFFDGDDHAVQACSAAVEMRRSLRAASSIRTSVGRLDLKMSVGVHSGAVDFFLVGDSHLELLVTGPTASNTARMEKIAEAGEIVISSATKASLTLGGASVAKEEGWLLAWRTGSATKAGRVTREEMARDTVLRLISVGLREHLTELKIEPEHRIVSVAFIRYSGVDELLATEGGAATATHLHSFLSHVQTAAEAEGVTFLDSDIDVDGGKILLYTGVPFAQEDDAGRMLRCLRRVLDAPTVLGVQIGVNRGHAYTGEVGSRYRCAFAAMGDVVNSAARVMTAAPIGALYATPAVLDRSSSRFDVAALEPLRVKGKSVPLRAYRVGAETDHHHQAEVATTLPFVGRRDEVATIVEALDRAATGIGSVVFVEARSGAGKTRLAHEALACRPELPVLHVRAEAYGASMAYQALRVPMRWLLQVSGGGDDAGTELTRRVAGLDPESLGYVPLLGDLTNIEVESTTEVDEIEPRFRHEVLAEVVERLVSAARPGPLVVVIDDAQWLDSASTELVERLMLAIERRPWAFVVLRRDEPTGLRPADDPAVVLRPLSRAEARELVHVATATAPLRPDEVDAVIDRADGVPLYVDEIVRALRVAGGLDALPDSLEEMVAIQLDQLAPAARQAVRCAAVFGRRFPPAPFGEVLDAEHLVLDAASTSELDDLLVIDDGQLSFRHALVQEVAYAGLSYRRRREMHGLAGDAIARVNLDEPERAAGMLSLHFERAGRALEAWRFARVAGDRAAVAYANAEAATQYERALKAAGMLHDIAPAERARVLEQLGDVRERSGSYDAARDAYRRAAAAVNDQPLAVAELWLKRARSHERGGHFSSALRDITRGVRLLDDAALDAGGLRARLLAFRSVIRQGEGRPSRAAREAREAVDAARRAGEQAALAQAYTVLDWSNIVLGRPELATLGRETLALYESLGDLEGQGKVMNTMGMMAYFADEWDDAIGWYGRARDIGLRTGNHVQAAISEMNIAEIHVNREDFEAAAPLLDGAIRVFAASGYADGKALAETFVGRMHIGRGEYESAEAALESALATFRSLNVPASTLEAAIHLAVSRVRRGAADTIDELLGPAIAAAGNESGVLGPALARVRAEAMMAAGRWDEARDFIEEGLAAAERHELPFDRRLLVALRDELDVRGNGVIVDVRDEMTSATPLGRLARTAPR